MKKRLWLIFGLLFIIFIANISMALTADEYFEFATNKYLAGDLKGAVKDLNQALKIDPTHPKALELMGILDEELTPYFEKTNSIPPTIAEPTLSPMEPKPELKTITPKFISPKPDTFSAPKPITKVNKPIAEKLIPNKSKTFYSILFSSTMTIILLALITSLFVLNHIRNHSRQIVCRECGSKNAHDAEFCKKCGFRLKATLLTDSQQRWFHNFNWGKNPFTLNIIPEAYSGHHAEISMIIEKLNTLSGHILVTGGLGTGKSTLLRWLEKNLKDRFETIYIVRPPARSEELIDLIAATISNKTTHTIRYTLHEFQRLLSRQKKVVLLLIDEAHEIAEEVEQCLRIIGDQENVIMVMAGLQQIREMLKHDLPALFDRIVETILLGSLSLEETKELIIKRISLVGGKGLGPFTATSIDKIHKTSFGVPRGILKICDWTVTKAIRTNKNFIDENDVSAYSNEIESTTSE